MATLTQKQLRLIDVLASEYVANYDRVTQQYLDLRRDIYQVYLARQRGEAVDDDRINTLRTRLAHSRREFTLHIEELIQLIEYHDQLKLKQESTNADISPDLVDYQQQIRDRDAAIDAQQKLIEHQINEINDVHKPLLDKLQNYIKSCESRARIPKWLGDRLELSRDEILTLFDDLPRVKQLVGELFDRGDLKDSRGAPSYDQILKKDPKNNCYWFDLRRRGKSAGNIDTSEAAVQDAYAEILRLDDEIAAQRELWSANAQRLLQFEGMLKK